MQPTALVSTPATSKKFVFVFALVFVFVFVFVFESVFAFVFESVSCGDMTGKHGTTDTPSVLLEKKTSSLEALMLL